MLGKVERQHRALYGGWERGKERGSRGGGGAEGKRARREGKLSKAAFIDLSETTQ